jgi:hypothetical protein
MPLSEVNSFPFSISHAFYSWYNCCTCRMHCDVTIFDLYNVACWKVNNCKETAIPWRMPSSGRNIPPKRRF